MKKTSKANSTISSDADDLRPEYDFKNMQVVARGPGRQKTQAATIRLAPDVAEIFPDEQAVNDALRLLIRIAKTESNYQRAVSSR